MDWQSHASFISKNHSTLVRMHTDANRYSMKLMHNFAE